MKLEKSIRDKLEEKTACLLEMYDFPLESDFWRGMEYEVDNYILENPNEILLATSKESYINGCIILNITNECIYFKSRGIYKNEYVFINSNYENLLKCVFLYDSLRKNIINKRLLGAYYDNSLSGGNFEKYANLLKDIIEEVDPNASKEGLWFSLITEMSIGVI